MVQDAPSPPAQPARAHAALPPEIDRLIQRHQEERLRPVPGWVGASMRVLPRVLITVTLINLFIGVLAAVTPLLGAWFGSGVTDPIYSAYSLICPQRPSHTYFIGGLPMAFEQRDLAMHIGFGIAGLLYLRARRLRLPLPTLLLVAGIAPLLVDVALSTAGILPSTWFSRSWTGALASLVIVWWSYPRFDAYLDKVRRHVGAIQGKGSRA